MMKYISSIILCLFFTISFYETSIADFPIVDDLAVAQSLSESTEQPLVVIFGAKSCGFCVLLKKDIQDGYFLMQLDGKIVCYIDVTKRQDLIDKYGIKSLPDSRLFIKGKQKSSIIGYDRSKYDRWLTDDK